LEFSSFEHTVPVSTGTSFESSIPYNMPYKKKDSGEVISDADFSKLTLMLQEEFEMTDEEVTWALKGEPHKDHFAMTALKK